MLPHGSFPVTLPQYVCTRVEHERKERKLAVDRFERKLGVFATLLDVSSILCLARLRCEPSHRGMGPDMTGRSGTRGFLDEDPTIRRKKPKIPPDDCPFCPFGL